VDDAIAFVRTGLKENQDVAQYHRDLASFLERAGRITEAAAEYREYARLAPNAPDSKMLIERASALEQKAASTS
jgi:predicted RNA polymerase sigma factor